MTALFSLRSLVLFWVPRRSSHTCSQSRHFVLLFNARRGEVEVWIFKWYSKRWGCRRSMASLTSRTLALIDWRSMDCHQRAGHHKRENMEERHRVFPQSAVFYITIVLSGDNASCNQSGWLDWCMCGRKNQTFASTSDWQRLAALMQPTNSCIFFF